MGFSEVPGGNTLQQRQRGQDRGMRSLRQTGAPASTASDIAEFIVRLATENRQRSLNDLTTEIDRELVGQIGAS